MCLAYSLHVKYECFPTSYGFFLLKILEAVSLIDVRRRFIEALVPQFGWPLEADPVCSTEIIIHFIIV